MQGPVQDEVIAKLRSAFLEIVQEYKVYTEEEKKKVNLFLTDNLLDLLLLIHFLILMVAAGCGSWWTSCGGHRAP